MSQQTLIATYVRNNPRLTDEDISVRLGVPVSRVREARSSLGGEDTQGGPADTLPVEGDTRSKMFPDKERPDMVTSPRRSLERKLRQLDTSFEVACKEFMLDPSSDNASNMNSFLNTIKATLKELDSFSDMSETAEAIINKVLVPLTKELMVAAYNSGKKIVEEYRELLPMSMKYRVDEFPKEFSVLVGKESKAVYDRAIDALELVTEVNLGKYRNSERTEALPNGKTKPNKK